MARIRAKLVAGVPSAAPATSASERSGNALRDFLAVQEEYASAMIHALEVIGATLDDFHDEKENTPAPRVKGRQRKTR
jgi:hypothetical protein